MLEDKDIIKFQAYILYSKNIDNILKRIVNYLNDCSKLIADMGLSELLKRICEESQPSFIEFTDYKVVEEVIGREPVGKGVVFRISSPKNDIYAIAFIPINNFNKAIASKR